jgi:hypothetical protein
VLGGLLGIAPLARAREQPLDVVARIAAAPRSSRRSFGPNAAAADICVQRRAADAERLHGFVGIEPRGFLVLHVDC